VPMVMIMNNLTKDYITIDTNVFVHLFSEQENEDNHIDKLLRKLIEFEQDEKIMLLVDCKGRITREYYSQLQKKLDNEDNTSGRATLLEHWIGSENHHLVAVDFNDGLMGKINKIVPTPPKGKRNTDRILVYVAFKKYRILITNDRKDIIDCGNLIDERRKKLRRIRGSKSGADILTSKEAYAKL